MYNPSFRVKKNGVPVVSKKELDAIGERFVRDFQPDVLKNPAPVDIDGFIECYLGMPGVPATASASPERFVASCSLPSCLT